MDERPILGLIEKATVKGTNKKELTLLARIDTGAQNSSIDLDIAQQLQLGPIIKTKTIRNSHGQTLRPVIRVPIHVGTKDVIEEFTIANRSKMKYKILIGQNILNKGFLIDPLKRDHL
ncbi:MAG: RimK/LysX family protein [Candidatus Woesearchaeota archaeon]